MSSVYRAVINTLRLPTRLLAKALPPELWDHISFEARSFLGRLTTKALRVDRNAENYLNLGSANILLPGQVNVDFFSNRSVYGADLRYPLRMDDAVFNGIFTEHTLEHLTYDQVKRLFAECHRIMKPGAHIRIIVPDISILAEKYVARDAAWFKEWEAEMLSKRGRVLDSPMQAISFTTQEHGHRSAWDFDSMRVVLSGAGFIEIKKREAGVGAEPRLLHDRMERCRTMLSLYVEAQKPQPRAA